MCLGNYTDIAEVLYDHGIMLRSRSGCSILKHAFLAINSSNGDFSPIFHMRRVTIAFYSNYL